MSEAAIAYAQKNGQRFVEELKELLRIPSVSTAPEHAGDVRKAAEWAAEKLRAAGMENVRLIETTSEKHKNGHPLVYADWLHAEPSADGSQSRRSCAMRTTMCSRPIRWMSGSLRRLSRPSATATCMRVGRWMTRVN